MKRRTFLGRALATVSGAVAAARVGAPPATKAVAAPAQGHLLGVSYVDVSNHSEFINHVHLRHTSGGRISQELTVHFDDYAIARASSDGWGRQRPLNVRLHGG